MQILILKLRLQRLVAQRAISWSHRRSPSSCRSLKFCPRIQLWKCDLEVEHEEQQGSLWYIRYPVVDGHDAEGAPHTHRRVHHGRDDAAGDVRRRRRGRREPEGRSLHGQDRPHRHAPRDPARDPRARRRGDRDGVRHRRGEGHARTRPDRLRDRPAPRPAHHQRHEQGRDDE